MPAERIQALSCVARRAAHTRYSIGRRVIGRRSSGSAVPPLGSKTVSARLSASGHFPVLSTTARSSAVHYRRVPVHILSSRIRQPSGPAALPGLEVRITAAPGGQEVFILCRSAERRAKEQAMHERFEKRIEEGLGKIQTSCLKKKQKPVTIATRVGRLLGRNTRAAALFEVKVEADAGGFARLRWSKVEAWREWARLSEGCYVLRSNVTDWSPEDLWRAYIQLTEAEAAFHIHKSDLGIRPVRHQKEDRVQAHILVCFLAYVLWKTLAASCREAGLGDEPRQVFEALSEIAMVDVVLPTRSGQVIRKRCISQPTEHQQILLQRLGLKLPSALERAAM